MSGASDTTVCSFGDAADAKWRIFHSACERANQFPLNSILIQMLQHSRERQERYFRNPGGPKCQVSVLLLFKFWPYEFRLSSMFFCKAGLSGKNLMINTKPWGQSHLTQETTAGKLSFPWPGNLGSHWSADDSRRQRYGPDNCFSLPTHESRTSPSSIAKHKKTLCWWLDGQVEEERAVQVTHREVRICCL